ncbi:hypothetical protein KI387_023359 [Taxus chinensis]|uniref:WRKY domain-containing protein n=1 Tax=Taxus chinensis TaxID=29808 RepID=A0AA38G1N3_TAXCH|nr:hypothetical protein KI387_023359 [Taxus chinensis]
MKTRVVRFMDANLKGNNHGQPSDSWAWRKYGQKPIKGSPYPRSYYRCSSCKGCPAKKQVERSQTEPSILIVTYTSDHNHPWQPRAVTNKKPVREEASPEHDQKNAFIISPDYDPLLSSTAAINEVVEEEVIVEFSSMKWGPNIEEEDRFFADLGELPEYSTIFSQDEAQLITQSSLWLSE